MQFFALASSALLLATSSIVSAAPLLSGAPIVTGGNALIHLNYLNNFLLQSCAVQAPDYMTYSIVGSVNDCLDFCDTVSGCNFANFYKDTNSVKKDGFTCSLYRSAHDTSSLTNCGNQNQKGDGTRNSISGSAGYVKTF